MSKYKLKPGFEAFDVVDGPLAGRKFKRGVLYSEIPENEASKFEEVQEEIKPETADLRTMRQANKRASAESAAGKESES